MRPDDIPEKTELQKENQEFFKLQLAAAFKVKEEAQKNKVDTPENLKDAENLLKGAKKCIKGTFTSYIDGEELGKFEDKIEKTKTNSKFVTTVKKWVNKFVELCKSPNSISRKKDLEQETVKIKSASGKTVKIKGAVPVIPVGTEDIQKELKAKLKEQTETKQPKKKSNLERSKPVEKGQKDDWKKHTAGRKI